MTVAQKLLCRVERITPHGEHVYTLDLRPERPAPRFRPGQFLHLALDTYDPSGFWPESRVFSIASPPAQRERLRLTYSVRGRFTARMERELTEGQSLWIKLPYGDFVIDDGSDVALFAGGTGITAFTAFLDGLPPDFQHRVYLAYGARHRGLLIYRDLAQQRALTVPVLQTFYFVEQDTALPSADTPANPGSIIGRVSAAAIWPSIARPSDTVYYVSGPPLMIETISKELRGFGVRSEAIRIDAWE